MSWLNWIDKLSKKQDYLRSQILGKSVNGTEEIGVKKVGDEWHLRTSPETIPEKSNKAAMIDSLSYSTELKPVPYKILDVDVNGRIYAGTSHYIQYSDDGGETWSGFITDETDIPTVRRLIALDSGELLIMSTSGSVWKSDTNQANWVEVLPEVGGTGFEEGNFTQYNNIILAGNYGSNLESLQVWLSTDYGDTFRNILTSNPSVAWVHMHDVAYDPYENIIWACNGDDYDGYEGEVSGIWYTSDMGESWQWIKGVRATTIIPLPDRVLFLSDVSGRTSVFSHERPKRGTNIIRDVRPASYEEGMDFISLDDWKPPYGLKEVFYTQVYETEAVDSAMSWGSNPYIKYWKGFKSIFGFRTPPGNPLVLWGTTTGEDFVALWSSDKNVNTWGYGINGVYGDETKLYASVNLEDDTGTLKDYMLVLTPN